VRRTASAFSLYELTESRVTMTVLVAAVVLSALRLHGSDFETLIAEPDTWILRPWTLVTSTLLHVSWWHLAFNVYWTATFGVAIESVFGLMATAGLYLLFAIASSLPQVVLGGGGIGLSGIGYAMFGLLWTLNRHDSRFRGCLDARTTVMFVGWFFVCIALTATDTMPIGNWAHGAGAVVGAATGWAVADTSKSVIARAIPLFAVLSALTLSCTALRPILASHEARAHSLAREGDRLNRAEEYASAEKVLEQVVEMDEDDWRSWWNLGYSRWKLGRHSEALIALGKAAELHSLPTESWNFLVEARTAELVDEGNKLNQSGEFALAEKVLEQLSVTDQDWQVWWNLGYARWMLGEHEAAIEAFDKAAAHHTLSPADRKFLDEAHAWRVGNSR
jgi:membrane associated rhomboid family serine protease